MFIYNYLYKHILTHLYREERAERGSERGRDDRDRTSGGDSRRDREAKQVCTFCKLHLILYIVYCEFILILYLV
jgi:hypothetical protein